MIGEALFAVSGAISGVQEILSDGRLTVLLVTQATCCIAAGLAASYVWQHRAARAHQVLLVSLLASVVMPMSYLLVKHVGLGILTSQTPSSYSQQQHEASAAEPAMMMDVGVARVSASDGQASGTEIDEDDLFDDSLIFDPTEPDFADAAWVDPAAASAGTPWPALFAGCSLITGIALFARLLWQFGLGRRLVDRAQRVEADDIRSALEEAKARVGVSGPVQLRSSRDVCSPLIWCWGRVPVLLVHQRTSRTPSHCDWVGIFCHELAHWKRLDHVTGLFCEMLLCAAPWHPLLWWARNRLATLSEEACDDWVLAGGQVGVDYAESLLGLSPQAQMAFLPTVGGKENAMKERICRILKDRCGNPKAGARWAVLIGMVAIGASATVALAQPRPPLPPGSGEVGPAGPANPAEVSRPAPPRPLPADQRPLAVQGRRNVLSRMLENLREQRRHAEAELQERGDGQDDQTVILHSELMAIQNHIQMVERQLQGLNQPQPLQPPPAEQRLLRLQNRIGEAETRLRQLEEQGQGDSEQARRVRENLRQAREEMQQARQQVNPSRGPEPPGVAPSQQPVRLQPQLQEQVQQLQNQMSNLNRQMEQVQRTLNQLVQQRSAGQPQ